jgi:death on curing protein
MRYLSLAEVLELHRQVIGRTGGLAGLRDLGALESSLAQPRQTFEGKDLYPDLVAKVGALGFSLIANHCFVDGNKRVGHAAMEATLLLNGHEFAATVDEAERIIVGVASGTITREQLTSWVREHLRPIVE